MHDGALGTLQRLVGAADEVLAALGEHHDSHIVRDELALDEHADEVEISLGCGREAHLDLLESHGDEQVPETQLAFGVLVVRHTTRLLRIADESCRRQQRVVVPPIGRRGYRCEIKNG